MEEKRFLEDVPTEILQAKLRRANGAVSQVITEEILYRATFSDNHVPKIQYPDHNRILQNRIIRHFHFLISNAERKIYPIEIRIPKDEFEELSLSEQEFVNSQIKKYWQVKYKWI